MESLIHSTPFSASLQPSKDKALNPRSRSVYGVPGSALAGTCTSQGRLALIDGGCGGGGGGDWHGRSCVPNLDSLPPL